MISMLRGRLFHKDFIGATIDVNGVGYRVNMPLTGLESLPDVGSEVTLHVHTSVREDAIELFGFTEDADRRLFAKLISVSGVGPRLGLSILSSLTAGEVVSAINRGDINVLKSVKGIGKKTAERLVLELGDKIKDLNISTTNTSNGPSGSGNVNEMLDDLRSALSNLGFPAAKADQTVLAVRSRVGDLSFNELLKEALKELRS